MKITMLTLFPEMYRDFTNTSIVARAIKKGLVEVEVVDIRDYASGSYRHVDDSPFGGGAGMILKCQPVLDCIEDVCKDGGYTVLMSPAGTTYNQKKAHEYAEKDHLVLLCGHYEGIDARINEHVDELVSIGDYVLTGGELASMVIADSVIRLLKGSIKEESASDESYENDLLEYPQYTKPEDYKGQLVPKVLLSGHHEKIRKWRLKESLRLTRNKRPDLLEKHVFTKEEEKLMEMLDDEENYAEILSHFDHRFNVRELGGLETPEGKTVRHGLFFRGAAPGRFSEEELEWMKQFHLKSMLDFRHVDDAAVIPDPLFEGCTNELLPAAGDYNPATGGFSPEDSYRKKETRDEAVGRYEDFYRSLAFGNKAYQRMFDLIKAGKTPMYLHCHAGKDRTGVACMLILLLLGVDEESAKQEYLLTNNSRKEALEHYLSDHRQMLEERPDLYDACVAWIGVLESCGDAVLTSIKERYPSYEAYFEGEYGITAKDRKRIRSRCLY